MRMRLPTTPRMLVVVAALAVLIPSGPARAGHYDLSSIEIVDQATMAAFSSLKIATTQDLWEATRTPGKVKSLARKAKVAPAMLRGLHDLCDLLWIDGIGPKVARVLTAADVKNLAVLARQEPVPLAERIRDTNRKLEVLGKLPDPDTTRSWIEQAKARLKAGVRPARPTRR